MTETITISTAALTDLLTTAAALGRNITGGTRGEITASLAAYGLVGGSRLTQAIANAERSVAATNAAITEAATNAANQTRSA